VGDKPSHDADDQGGGVDEPSGSGPPSAHRHRQIGSVDPTTVCRVMSEGIAFVDDRQMTVPAVQDLPTIRRDMRPVGSVLLRAAYLITAGAL
jgi:hypothetical protein